MNKFLILCFLGTVSFAEGPRKTGGDGDLDAPDSSRNFVDADSFHGPNKGGALPPSVEEGAASPSNRLAERHPRFQFLYTILKIDEYRLKQMNPKFFSKLPIEEQKNRSRKLEKLLLIADDQLAQLPNSLKTDDDLSGLFAMAKVSKQLSITRQFLLDQLAASRLPEHVVEATESELKTYWYKKWKQPGSAPKPYTELTASEHTDLLREFRVLKFQNSLEEKAQIEAEKL